MLRFNKNIQGTRDSDNYKTPKMFYDGLNKEFNFDFDPYPYKHNLSKWDGLKVDWKGSIFVNPPYSQVELWLRKGIKEIQKNNSTYIVYLIPLRTDSWYWHNTILKYSKEIRLVRGRLNFGRKELSPFPVVLVIFDDNLKGEKLLSSYEKEDKIRNQKTLIFRKEKSRKRRIFMKCKHCGHNLDDLGYHLRKDGTTYKHGTLRCHCGCINPILRDLNEDGEQTNDEEYCLLKEKELKNRQYP